MPTIITGPLTLRNGRAITAPCGGSMNINGDSYPVTILGASPSGATLYYRRAEVRVEAGARVFLDEPSQPTLAATWRRGKRGGCYRPKGDSYCSVTASGYRSRWDPHF